MNNWYNRATQQAPAPMQNAPMNVYSGMTFQNPMQRMAYIMQAMRNPAAFVKQHIPDIPDEISNDPDAILSFLRQNKGLTDMDIQRVTGGYPNAYR